MCVYVCTVGLWVSNTTLPQSKAFPLVKDDLKSLRTGIMAGSICPVEVTLGAMAFSRSLMSRAMPPSLLN